VRPGDEDVPRLTDLHASQSQQVEEGREKQMQRARVNMWRWHSMTQPLACTFSLPRAGPPPRPQDPS
jgi:hypothetical protein